MPSIRSIALLIPLVLLSACSLQRNQEPADLDLGTSWSNANVNFGAILLNANTGPWVATDGNANANGAPMAPNANANGDMANANANANAAITPSPSPSNTNGSSPEGVRTVPVLPPELPSDPVLLAPHEVAFDCGTPASFAKRKFYDRFIVALENLPRYSGSEAAILLRSPAPDGETPKRVQQGLESRDNLSVVCYAKDASMILALVASGADGLGGKLVRYTPYRDLAEVAARGDEIRGDRWPVFPTSFGARRGRVIALKGTSRSPQGTTTGEFAYDYVSNFLEFVACGNGRADPCHQQARPLPSPAPTVK